MNIVKGVLLIVLIFSVSAPCFGSIDVIKRKKNKWFLSEEVIKTTSVDCDNQSGIESFG
jgi:hypothetical protein